MTRTVRLDIAFQGTRYEGWQSQLKNKTIQEAFECVLEKLFGHKTILYSSSRTDSGVHARGLVTHFKTASRLSDGTILKALNFHLPRDIVVLAAKTVPASFHARYSAKSKLYRYVIWNHPIRPVFEDPYVLWHPHKLDVSAMRRAAKHFLGAHDFRGFMDGGEDKKSFVRKIKRLSVRKQGPQILIDIEANGFLRHMVRIIVGTLIDVGRKKTQPDHIPNILASKDRSKAGATAKARGLTLVRVQY